MDKKEKLSDILGPIIKEEPILKLTAEEFVVMRLQSTENNLRRHEILLNKEQENNELLNKKIELFAKIIDFIFENFKFEFASHTLYVNYGYVNVDDEAIKNCIDGFIKIHNQAEEDEQK